jgi:Family of unknown function (DUF5681)
VSKPTAPAPEQDIARSADQVLLGRLPDGTWPRGVSGNPSGRPPKGHTLGDKLRAKLAELSKLKGGSDGRTVGDDVVDGVIQLALSGEPHAVRAVELILDRIDGKVSIPIEVSQVTMLIDPEDDVQ